MLVFFIDFFIGQERRMRILSVIFGLFILALYAEAKIGAAPSHGAAGGGHGDSHGHMPHFHLPHAHHHHKHGQCPDLKPVLMKDKKEGDQVNIKGHKWTCSKLQKVEVKTSKVLTEVIKQVKHVKDHHPQPCKYVWFKPESEIKVEEPKKEEMSWYAKLIAWFNKAPKKEMHFSAWQFTLTPVKTAEHKAH